MAADAALADSLEKPSRGILGYLSLFVFFLGLLIVFTMVKVPQSKIQAWILGTLNQQMGPMGMQISADDGRIVLGLGLKYEMSGIRLTKMSNQKVLKFSRMEVAPSIIVPLLQGKLGGTFRLEEGTGSIAGSVMAKGEDFEAAINLDSLNLGRMGILPFAADVEGTSDIKGTINLAGTASQATSLAGNIDLTLTKTVIDAQKVMGFDVPRTSLSEGVISISIGAGKATISTFRLGKANGTDDLNATLTGDIKLNKAIESSDANLKLKLAFADRYKQEKTISLLDSLLGMFKLPDGTFAMKFIGPLYAVQPIPDK